MLVRGADHRGETRDIRLRGGRVVAIEPRLAAEPGEEVLDAAGGALLPGLHDHHLHLHALAAAQASVDCGPPACPDAGALERALRGAQPDRGWIRGTNYFESVAGPLDRAGLDRLRSDVPVRIQHRSGVLWFLNSRGIDLLGLHDPGARAGHRDRSERDAAEAIERGPDGRATGRLFRADDWLRERLSDRAPPDLGPVGERLSRFGVTAVTDTTPTNGLEELALFRRAQASGALPQRVEMMGRLLVNRAGPAGTGLLAGGEPALLSRNPDSSGTNVLRLGAHKIMLDEPALPDLDSVVDAIRGAHGQGRGVAIHTVTRAEIHFALAAYQTVGARRGDRLEHASVAPVEAVEAVRRLGLTIVTQPNFVSERGDHYLREVDERDQPHLYRLQSWIDAGVRLTGGTDAPFGDPDPWRAMRAAVDRKTAEGAVLGEGERLSPEAALALFQRGVQDQVQGQAKKGVARPRIEDEAPTPLAVGDAADCFLLDAPWRAARNDLSSDHVVATFIDGRRVYSTDSV